MAKKRGPSENYVLTEDERGALLRSCKDVQDRVIILLPLYCGLRVGECIHMDSQTNVINMRCPLTGAEVSIQLKPSDVVSMLNEFVVYVDANLKLTAVAIANLSDDFDFEKYGKLLYVMHNHPSSLFF